MFTNIPGKIEQTILMLLIGLICYTFLLYTFECYNLKLIINYHTYYLVVCNSYSIHAQYLGKVKHF